MNVLFICKFNRFRSKVAEAVFKKLNKNSKNKVKSAGIIRGSPSDKDQVAVAKEMGFDINSAPHGLTTEMLKWHDLAVIVADDVPRDILRDNKKYGKELEVWKINDVYTGDKKSIEKVIKEIQVRVGKLIRKL